MNANASPFLPTRLTAQEEAEQRRHSLEDDTHTDQELDALFDYGIAMALQASLSQAKQHVCF